MAEFFGERMVNNIQHVVQRLSGVVHLEIAATFVAGRTFPIFAAQDCCSFTSDSSTASASASNFLAASGTARSRSEISRALARENQPTARSP